MNVKANFVFKFNEEKDLALACYATISSINFMGGCYGLPHIISSYITDEDKNTIVLSAETELNAEDIRLIQDKFTAIDINELEDTVKK